MTAHRSSPFRHPSVVLALGLVASLIAGAAAAVDIPFDNGTNVDTATNRGFSVAFADLDRDGDQDVLSAVSTPGNTLSWFENTTGLGTTFTERTIVSSWTGATSVFTGDVDGDGDLDVLGCAFDLGDVVVWRNDNGLGTAWTNLDVDLAVPGPRQAVFADLDRDGDLDVVGAANATGTKDVMWWENTAGDGTAWSAHTIDTTMNGARSVGVGDIDGDGDPDVVVSAEFDDKVVFYENVAGTGLTWTETQVNTALFDGGSNLTLADFDGDGDLDVAAVAEAAANVVLWRNTVGDGSAWSEVLVSPSLNGAYGIAHADIDADGDQDIATAARAGLRTDWWENTAGDASSWTGHLVESYTAGNAGRSVAVGDSNGDGLIDIASNLDSRLELYKNESIHHSLTWPLRGELDLTAAGAADLAAGDIDRDGDLDAVGAAATDGELVFYENLAGDATTFGATVIGSGLGGVRAVALGDIDRDGKLDVAAAVETAGDLIWWRNVNGDGSTWTATTIDPGFGGTRDLLLADLDGDGHLDAAAVGAAAGEVAFFRNTNGDGSLWNELSAGIVTDASAIADGDLDRDGDLDLVAAGTGGDDLVFFENQEGDGTVWAQSFIAGSFDGAADVELGDVDSDGDLDVIAVAEVADDIAWFENVALVFTERTIDGAFDGARGVAVADFDADGNLDLAASRPGGGGQVQIYRNTLGTGLSWNAAPVPSAFAGSARLSVADLDGDGRIDLLGAASTDGDFAYFRNGGGQAALPTVNTSPASLGNSITDDLLKITLEHRGKTGENPVELATVELRFEDGAETPLTSAAANGIIENLSLFLDDGNGISDGGDVLVQTDATLALVAGVHTMTLVDGDVNLGVNQGTFKTYFVVAQTTVSYSAQPLAFFRMVHVTESSSRVEDRPNDARLRLEYLANVGTNLLQVNPSAAAADLELVSLTDGPDPVLAGNQLTYTIEVVNNGPAAAQNVTVEGALPPGTTLVSTTGCLNDPAGAPSCQLGTLAIEQEATITVVVLVGSGTSPGTLNYSATLSSTTPEASAGDEEASVSTTVNRQGNLAMSLVQPQRDYTDGAPITYRITVSNAGPSDSTNAAVTDTFPPILTGVTWTCSGTGGSTCPAAGSGNLAAVSVSVKAGQSITFVATGNVPDGHTAVISNTASVGDVNDPSASNNIATVNSPWGNPIFFDGFESGSTAAWSADFP